MSSNSQQNVKFDAELAPDIELAILPTKAFSTPDSTNPKDWPNRIKWAVTDVLSATGFNRIMVSTIMAPPLTTIAIELHMSHIESIMALSIYLLATAFGPLVIGPLSEVYGREKVLHASNIWFLVWNIVCGFAKTKEVLIAAGFLAGFGASSIYALAGGVLGDVWRLEHRGKSLGVYLVIPLLGAAVEPIIGGFMAGRTTWRWMFWSTSIFQAETYAPVILARRTKKLREITGDSRYFTEHERLSTDKSVLLILSNALTRPLRLLLFHPIIIIASVNLAFDYSILYIVLTSFAQLWTDYYHVSVETSGLHYLAVALGELAGAQIGAPMIDRFYRWKQAQHPDGDLAPEYRLPIIFPGALLAPVGLFIYGWTAEYRVHWIAVDIGVFIAMFGLQMSGMAWQAYIMDAYADHTSSARAATQFPASLTAFLFPLFVPAMYRAMGYGWGNTGMAFASFIFAVPGPIALWYHGASLRARARSTY
ncbi:hypothetical protein E8E12_008451 [Didymella heteroderae]|uniref:Major facilitator superfamily (MFS) profile domain-containing protein n=1 Tax=Didymella heteroderae TaxID=1769908 RepID=A0A9P4WNH2_9PLEO|nr:hypothetical protein E8E12_008451 [Didymella heteroderae]